MEALKPADNAPIKHIWEKMHRGSRYMGAAKPGNARKALPKTKMYFALKKIIDELRDCLKSRIAPVQQKGSLLDSRSASFLFPYIEQMYYSTKHRAVQYKWEEIWE